MNIDIIFCINSAIKLKMFGLYSKSGIVIFEDRENISKHGLKETLLSLAFFCPPFFLCMPFFVLLSGPNYSRRGMLWACWSLQVTSSVNETQPTKTTDSQVVAMIFSVKSKHNM